MLAIAQKLKWASLTTSHVQRAFCFSSATVLELGSSTGWEEEAQQARRDANLSTGTSSRRAAASFDDRGAASTDDRGRLMLKNLTFGELEAWCTAQGPSLEYAI